MAPSTPLPLDFDHKKGFEISTKHKEAIRQLHWYGKVSKLSLQGRYKLGDTTINKILGYPSPSRFRSNRKGRPQLINDQKLDSIIQYLSESYTHRILNYDQIIIDLKLKCSSSTLQKRLHQRGYFRCTACQKPFLTLLQVTARWIWGLAHLFWHTEWLNILWSDECTFLLGGKTAKAKVTRIRGERYCETCIQYQLHRGGTTPVHVWGAIGYGYKSPLLFVKGTGKNGAFKQTDYLSQVLEYIKPILQAFGLITPGIPLFMEDGNSAHGHKSTSNCCAKYRAKNGILLMPHPSTSPDMNPIEKCWRWMKQSLHRRRKQPSTVLEMEAMLLEEWDRIPQEWINGLVEKHEHWVHVLVQRRGWSTPN